jgi:predicted RNA-binding protein
MCLSKVYLDKEEKDKILIEEASGIVNVNGTIEVYSIFGENKKIKGCYIKKVDFLKSTTILAKKVIKNEK